MRFTHGLFSQQAVIPGESQDAFRAFRSDWIRDLRPIGTEECALVEQMVVAQWRLKRVWATQTGVYERFEREFPAGEGDSHPERLADCFADDCAHQRELDKLSLHEVRLVNIFQRCGRRLDLLRDQRRKQFARPKDRPFPGEEVYYAEPEAAPQPAVITPAPAPVEPVTTPSNDAPSGENADRGPAAVAAQKTLAPEAAPAIPTENASAEARTTDDVGADRDPPPHEPPPRVPTVAPDPREIERLETEDNRWRVAVDGRGTGR
jgi:hypothetical protein